MDCRELYDDERKLQRAHHTLSFLNQFYIHSLPPRHASRPSNDPIAIPASIAVPFVDVSRKLGIAPIVTYADTVLWNWDLIDPSLPLSRSNIKICDLFTGTKQEEHFFLTSARIEIEGWTSLNAIRMAMEVSESKNPSVELVSHHLRRLAKSLDQITTILFAVRDNLDPDFFYNRFRPVSFSLPRYPLLIDFIADFCLLYSGFRALIKAPSRPHGSTRVSTGMASFSNPRGPPQVKAL